MKSILSLVLSHKIYIVKPRDKINGPGSGSMTVDDVVRSDLFYLTIKDGANYISAMFPAPVWISLMSAGLSNLQLKCLHFNQFAVWDALFRGHPVDIPGFEQFEVIRSTFPSLESSCLCWPDGRLAIYSRWCSIFNRERRCPDQGQPIHPNRSVDESTSSV